MANHGATVLLLMVSLLVADALSGADARLTAQLNAAAVQPDANKGDHHAGATVQEVEPTCSNVDLQPQPTPEPPCNKSNPQPQPTPEPPCSNSDPQPQPTPEPPCSNSDPQPQPTPEPPCSNSDPQPQPTPEPPSSNSEVPKPELTCNKFHGVQVGETCESIEQCAGLTHDQFLGFNPNIDCCKIFPGQWVCLEVEATPKCD